ncbi:hypothetical protein C2S53_020298 [Perilla frutescens var. hirtella]|uniref:Uncharacterized protein n=1 Tax=Perilla frutescens var. hirtella TaxID=608512 RepID=A0AAD4ITD8_PERFH|nr:hypothetical protein C2S53_020298 [Perilla frutescens var. hirtella]
MGFLVEEDHSTPKLTLSKLPCCKPREAPPPPLHMQTPPLRPSVSIPFHWEEAPGKPRAAAATLRTPPSCKSKAARCLELPPRLLHEDAKITMMPSPTTVLDGPYVGRSLSLACTFSFRKGLAPGREKSGGAGAKIKNLGSGRWGSFRDERKFDKESFDFSQSLGDIFRSEDNNVKITRVRRRRSFFSLSTINSKYLWGDIYASFKQAVPWRRSP